MDCDEDSMNTETIDSSFQQNNSYSFSTGPRQRFVTPSKIGKRLRTQQTYRVKQLPIIRMVESLDRTELQKLLDNICQKHPSIVEEISSLVPRVTTNSALEILNNHMNHIYNCLPYRGDQRGDYAYLRVRPAIEEFLSALSDYTCHFLPPNEAQPSNTLAYLDGATSLLHRLPDWDNIINNHNKHMVYEELTSAWILTIREACKKANGMTLAYGGWKQKLEKHNELSGNRLEGALAVLAEELSWLGDDDKTINGPFMLAAPVSQ